MRPLSCFLLALGVATLAFSVTGQSGPAPNTTETKSAVPVEQPLPFSHKTHAAAHLACQDCHNGKEEHMGLPATTKCMICHVLIKKDQADIQKLAGYAQSKEPIPWKRLYKLADYVFFSHATHLAAGAKCEACHGAVAEQNVLAKPAGHFMQGCMNCHQQHNASVDCQTCHEAAR